MKIHSLELSTNFIFAKYSGKIVNKAEYTMVQTPAQPNYYWGNYIVFKTPPKAGSLKHWTEIFNREFTYYSEPNHYTFTWQSQEQGDCSEFLNANFELDSTTVLTSSNPKPPPFQNQNLLVRKIVSDKDWNDVVQLQLLCKDDKYSTESYTSYIVPQMKTYRKMTESNMGNWFGAFLNDKLVGDLGIFYEGQLARFQSLGTHPDFRRQGICGTLVFQSSQIALKEFGVKQLVMVADTNYHAARIYESVGFNRTETSYALNWWKGKTVE
jgi:hypothetical protein